MSELLTISEVARLLRVDDATVRRWVKTGVLEAVVLPHAHARHVYRVKRETLARALGTKAKENGFPARSLTTGQENR